MHPRAIPSSLFKIAATAFVMGEGAENNLDYLDNWTCDPACGLVSVRATAQAKSSNS